MDLSNYVAEESDGTRIRRLRRRAGLTQGELAARVGRAQSWVSMLEVGHVVLDSVSLINTLARALGVHPNEITGRPYRGATAAADRGHSAIPEIARQVNRYDLAPEWDAPVRPLSELAVEVARMEELRTQARYSALGEQVAPLIAELQAAAHTHTGAEQAEAFGLLAMTYRSADAVAYGLGYEHLSGQCTERIRWAAQRCGDPLLVAVADYLRVRGLWTSASWGDALAVLDAALAPIERDHDAGRPQALAVWGGLQLRAAITAARAADADEAWTRLDLAREAVDRLGEEERRDYYQLTSTRSNVAIHGVAVAVELVDGTEAVKRGATLRPVDLRPSRAGHHYMDLARGWLFHGNRDRALAAMEKAERIAPQLVRNHPMAHKTVRTLLDHEARSYRERLRRLGDRMHVL